MAKSIQYCNQPPIKINKYIYVKFKNKIKFKKKNKNIDYVLLKKKKKVVIDAGFPGSSTGKETT